tara:strand:- start:34 stop:156 length:123 start_codon:yes stop_codon:yes gene_type:complete
VLTDLESNLLTNTLKRNFRSKRSTKRVPKSANPLADPMGV